MEKEFDRVYQFKIVLLGIKPPIWRRIQVPETYTFWDLHNAIQDAMGWEDDHPHEFEILSPLTRSRVRIGTPDEFSDFLGIEILLEDKEKISDWFSMENKRAIYTYDFGDNWRHKITLEKILPRDKNVRYPVCLAGKRACPPEECGGVWGYMELLEALREPKTERHKELLEWIGDKFDPEYFDPKKVTFIDWF